MAAKAKGKLLDACRAALRIPAFVTDYDEEISDVIEAARAELVAGGVADAKAHDDSDGRVMPHERVGWSLHAYRHRLRAR